ncbi:MAG: hypothetical protein U1F68_15610 [Gammaproteobacteria bacterium]
MRDEADRIAEALQETFAIGPQADVPVVISIINAPAKCRIMAAAVKPWR